MLSKKLLVVALLILLGVGVGLYFVFRDNYKVKSDFGFHPIIYPVNIKSLYGECLAHCPRNLKTPKSYECQQKCADQAGIKRIPDFYGCIKACRSADSDERRMNCQNGCTRWYYHYP